MITKANFQKNSKNKSRENIFSILIPTWNNLEYLQLCIMSIKKNSHYSHQIIVFINEGADGTLEWIKEQDDIDYVYSEINVGVCYALNGCRDLVSTSYVLYINDDMYVCPDWDKYLYDEINAIGHPYFFLSATAIEPKASSVCAIEGSFGTDIHSFEEERLLNQYQDFQFNDWQGSTWPPNVVHISVWDLVGGYSVEFSPGMYSDPDFSMKLWNLGVRIFKGVSKSRVYHFGSKSVKRVKRNAGYYTFISKWGMPSSGLTSKILKRGQKYNGELKDIDFSLPSKIKFFWKRVITLFKI